MVFLIECLVSAYIVKAFIIQSYHPGIVRIEVQGPVLVYWVKKTNQMSQTEDINRHVHQHVLPLWKKAPWSIIEIRIASSLDTMWHNTDDDRDPSALWKKKNTNILISFAVSKVSHLKSSWESKHNYYQFKSSSFKCFLNQEACSRCCLSHLPVCSLFQDVWNKEWHNLWFVKEIRLKVTYYL